jgi:hypothetical protein
MVGGAEGEMTVFLMHVVVVQTGRHLTRDPTKEFETGSGPAHQGLATPLVAQVSAGPKIWRRALRHPLPVSDKLG